MPEPPVREIASMVTPTCNRCRRTLPTEDINVANDVAYCRRCNLSYKLSELTFGNELDQGVDLSKPPTGTWTSSSGLGPVIGVSHRSVGGAVGALLFGLFWNGIVSVFVLLALASTLNLLGTSLPAWIPQQMVKGAHMGVGMTIFLWLFLTPFIGIGLGMVWAFLMCLLGRTEVRVEGSQGRILTGIGVLSYRRSFQVAAVKDVRLEDSRWRDSDGDRRQKSFIVMELRDGKTLKLGSSLSSDQRKFVASALRRALLR